MLLRHIGGKRRASELPYHGGMLAHDDLTVWSVCAIFVLWVAWQLYGHYSDKAAMRRRREQLDRLASTFDLTLDSDRQSNDRRELDTAYNGAVAQNWGSDGLYHEPANKLGHVFAGRAVDILYKGHGLRLFQMTRGTKRGSRSWIGLGVHIEHLHVPSFRRQKRGSIQVGLIAARRRGNIVDWPDGSFALLRNAADKAAVQGVLSPPVLSFLEAHGDWEMAGNGDELWLSSTWDQTDEDAEATLVEAKRLFQHV